MTDKTVTQRHVDFARAVVQLAREHGFDNLRMSYGESLTWQYQHERDRNWNSADVTMNWREGRHGDRQRLSIEYRAAVTVEESA
ncbi:hypothetical protein [Cupriavidus necator]|uniref:hypothetical protein n=1 Tax=Cupriavidus necator TaxID=106590 RepID=UPI00339D397B